MRKIILLVSFLSLYAFCQAQAPDYVWHRDADGDGWGNDTVTVTAPEAPAGYVISYGDCDDTNPAIYPSAPDLCDGIDNDCNGEIDEPSAWLRDADGDGYGNEREAIYVQPCQVPAGYVSSRLLKVDCNDANPAIHPGATEIIGDGIDNDCNGLVDVTDPNQYFLDADFDGYGDPAKPVGTTPPDDGNNYFNNNSDCNDNDDQIYPGACDVNDGKDNDCDGQVDEDVVRLYRDRDYDGYGDAKDVGFLEAKCSPNSEGYSTNNLDCDDGNEDVKPSMPEVCGDGIDNNCNGQVDENCSAVTTWYQDADGDSYGNKAVSVQAITAPEEYVADNTDCDDTDANTHPSLDEYKEDNCSDGKDNDCDGLVDEDFSVVMLYRDKDGDGFGDAADAGFEGAYCATSKDQDFVQNNEDCDDNDEAVHPGASEICGNGKDDNCNGQIDEDCTPVVTLTCPGNKVVTTSKGLCAAVVTGIDPIVSGSAAVTYSLSGATKVSGTGTASGKSFNKGVTTVTYTLANDASVTCSFTVTVNDKEAPVITGVSVNPSVLWPANHKMVNVTVDYSLWDNCGAMATLSVKSNDGAASSDWQVVDAHHVLLRAERSAGGDGRTYTITLTAKDASGNKSTQTVAVTVPHDMSITDFIKNGVKSNLDIRVLPNPSYHFFTIRIHSDSNKPVQLRVTDAVGRVLEGRQNIGANTTVTVGHNYRPGVYYAEVLQGGKKVYVKLVKTSQ